MNVGEIVVIILVLATSVMLMFVFPLMTMADRNDDIAQALVEAATAEFAENVRTTGVLTLEDYDAFVQEIAATGNAYEIEMEADLSDANPNIKTTQVTTTKKGEYLYYIIYTVQMEDILNTDGALIFKEGDIFSVSVKNKSTTFAQKLESFFYQIANNNTYRIGTQLAVMVIVDGSK